MSAAEKRIEQMRNNPTNVKLEDIDWLLKQAGCQCRASGGSHHVYYNPDKYVASAPYGITVSYHKPIKKKYVKDALAYYDELMDLNAE